MGNIQKSMWLQKVHTGIAVVLISAVGVGASMIIMNAAHADFKNDDHSRTYRTQ